MARKSSWIKRSRTNFSKGNIMPCYRFKRRVFFVNAYPFSGEPRFSQRMIEVGDVVYKPPETGLGVFPDDFEIIPLPGDDGSPTTIDEIVVACQKLLAWILAGHLTHPEHIIRDRLSQLLDVFARLVDAPSPFNSDAILRARSVTDLIQLTKLLGQSAIEVTVMSKVDPTSKSWQEVAKRMEQRRLQGDPFTNQRTLAEELSCSVSTINKAIKKTPSLQTWAEPQGSVPKAQSLTAVVTDRTEQSREPNPVDDAARREYLDRDDLTPQERSFFIGLSPENQLFYVNDPDQLSKILGRKAWSFQPFANVRGAKSPVLTGFCRLPRTIAFL
jgi:hypothetical protein